VTTDDGAQHAVTAVQLLASADSMRAATLRDSLIAQGWVAYVRGGADSAGAWRWRVRVAPSADARFARRIASALRAEGREASVVSDTTAHEAATDAVIPVSEGSAGMTARVRWARSPDRCALLVVYDPTAVENDPLPNVFVYVSDAGPVVVRQDSVWDVAPSPAWDRLAYSRAYVVSARGRDSVSPAEWRTVAGRTGADVATVRGAAFPSSGMNIAYGVAQPVVLDLLRPAPGSARADSAARRALPTLGGWRVAWTRDGRGLALGAAPQSPRDDSPPREWRIVDPASGAAVGGAATAEPPTADSLANVRWRDGPVLDVSAPVDVVRRRTLAGPGYRIESRGGWIRLTRAGAFRDGRPVVVGPGVALAATASGQFVAALAPRIEAKEFDAPVEVVIYQVRE
jgi:hypothetical protein